MEILQFPDPFLFQITQEVTVFGEELKVLLDAMWETMEKAKGLGLSANQVGVGLAMFVMKGPEGRLDMVNPKIVTRSLSFIAQKEGCLSAIGEFIFIQRHAWIKIEYQDSNSNKNGIVLKDIYSVCAQHEMEHLSGQSFLENEALPRYERKRLAKKWRIK